jgi:hypothetical protein
MKHQHIGDAFFDVDAAEFLLGELQHQQQQQQPEAQCPTNNLSQQQQQEQIEQQQQQGQESQQPGASTSQPAGCGGGQPSRNVAQSGMSGVDGHAAGPKWVDRLPGGQLPANVRLERHALVR